MKRNVIARKELSFGQLEFVYYYFYSYQSMKNTHFQE